MIKLSEDWKKTLEAMKNCKFDVLKSFCFDVENFDFTKKYRSGNVTKYMNENAKRINKKNKPVDCIQILAFIFDQQISFIYCDKDDNKKMVTKNNLLVVERDGVKYGNLMDYKNGKSYDFQIKNNKVTKCKEDKAMER